MFLSNSCPFPRVNNLHFTIYHLQRGQAKLLINFALFSLYAPCQSFLIQAFIGFIAHEVPRYASVDLLMGNKGGFMLGLFRWSEWMLLSEK